MKKLVLSVLFLYGGIHTCYAALAPLQESIREIQTILNHPELVNSLNSSETILDIEHSGNTYVIITNNHQVVIDVIYHSQTRPGPQEFKLLFHQPLNHRKKIQ